VSLSDGSSYEIVRIDWIDSISDHGWTGSIAEAGSCDSPIRIPRLAIIEIWTLEI